jgi:hypothetical protein
MGICSKKDTNIALITEGKDALKSLMSEGMGKLDEMANIKTDMLSGLNKFNLGAIDLLPKGVSLQEELLKLSGATNPLSYAAVVKGITEQFGDVVSDLSTIITAAGDGSSSTICSLIDDIETKEIPVTDPNTGITTVTKVADNLPKKANVPKTPPAPPEPAPKTDTLTVEAEAAATIAFDNSLVSIVSGVNTVLKKYELQNFGGSNYLCSPFLWAIKDSIYEKGGEGSVDNSSASFFKRKPTINREEAEVRYNDYAAQILIITNNPSKAPDLESRKKIIWDRFVSLYSDYERIWNTTGITTYSGGEAGLVAFIKKSFDSNSSSSKETKATAIAEVEEVKAVIPEEATVAVVKPPIIPEVEAKELEEIVELTGEQEVVPGAMSSSPKRDPVTGRILVDKPEEALNTKIKYNADEWKAIRRGKLKFIHVVTKTSFNAETQEEYDRCLRVYNGGQGGKTEGSSGIYPYGNNIIEVKITIFRKSSNKIYDRELYRYGYAPAQQKRWDRRLEDGSIRDLVEGYGGDWSQVSALISSGT